MNKIKTTLFATFGYPIAKTMSQLPSNLWVTITGNWIKINLFLYLKSVVLKKFYLHFLYMGSNSVNYLPNILPPGENIKTIRLEFSEKS